MRKDHAISRAIPAHCLPNSFWRVKKVSETQRVTEQVADDLKPLRGQEQEQERAGLAAPCCIPKHKPQLSAALGPPILLWVCLQVCLLCADQCIAGKHCSATASYEPYSPRSGEPPAGGSLLPPPPCPAGPHTFCRDPNTWTCREGRARSVCVCLFASQGKGNVKQVSHHISVLAPKERKRWYSPDFIIRRLIIL